MIVQSMQQVLDHKGALCQDAKMPDLSDKELLRLFDTMLHVRVMDERMLRLQRQGRLGFYMTSLGEEATHLAVQPLTQEDCLFPSYRETGALFWRGLTNEDYINQLYGNRKDPIKGRQMPVHHSSKEKNIVSISSPVGTQIPQAVGAAMAGRKQGRAAMVFFGEGTSSTGSFHVGCNFAAVMKAPVVFICRNNGWAISVPKHKQTASETFAQKAIAYGMPGILVDGNDILAVVAAAQEAVAHAKAGKGPTLIELKTYRMGGHSSSDDPSVYRDEAEVTEWESADPVNRFHAYLKNKKLLTDDQETKMRDAHVKNITEAQNIADKEPPPEVETLFDDVFEEMPWHLKEQQAWLLQQKRTKSPHGH